MVVTIKNKQINNFMFQIFGSLTSCALKVSESFYGTGESFLYTFYPEFVVSLVIILCFSNDLQLFIHKLFIQRYELYIITLLGRDTLALL